MHLYAKFGQYGLLHILLKKTVNYCIVNVKYLLKLNVFLILLLFIGSYCTIISNEGGLEAVKNLIETIQKTSLSNQWIEKIIELASAVIEIVKSRNDDVPIKSSNDDIPDQIY